MGFWASAAKKGANPEVWAAAEAQVRAHRAGEAAMVARARALGASHTIIRAGTPISEGAATAARQIVRLFIIIQARSKGAATAAR